MACTARRRPGQWLSVRHGLAQERMTTIAENSKAGRLTVPCIAFRPLQGSIRPNGPRWEPGEYQTPPPMWPPAAALLVAGRRGTAVPQHQDRRKEGRSS
jgi:hypothetical protein